MRSFSLVMEFISSYDAISKQRVIRAHPFMNFGTGNLACEVYFRDLVTK